MESHPEELPSLRDAYGSGTFDHPALASTYSSDELLVREHAMTCLYWFGGRDPLNQELFQRIDDVLPTTLSHKTYLKHYRTWGQQMTQARLEDLAAPVKGQDFILPNSEITPPPFFYPLLALDFVSRHYRPDMAKLWGGHTHDDSLGCYRAQINKATIRGRELACLLGIYLEASQEDPFLLNYGLFLDRAIFTVLAFPPVVRLGMPRPFGNFVRQSMASLATYFFVNEKMVRGAFGLPSFYYDQVLECAAELVNLLPYVSAYSAEDCV
jgi:hypothetical protein